MATETNRVSTPNMTETTSHDEIQPHIQMQLKHISEAQEWLQRHKDGQRNHQGIVSAVSDSLESYMQWLLKAQNHALDGLDAPQLDRMSVTVQPGGMGASRIIVRGPAPQTTVAIDAEDQDAADYLLSDEYLGYMTKLCLAFSNAQKSLTSLFKLSDEVKMEGDQLSQPAEVTVQTHIRRLKEYNDMKDVGQQLIGLIAENRGLPVGRLYEDGQYGVTGDD